MENIPTPPQLFLCKKCKVYFYSFSKLTNPTHTKCHLHNTELATKEDIERIEVVNQINQVRRKRI